MSSSKRSDVTPQDADAPVADEPIVVVGIGASAGGLEALQQFFEPMPPNTGMAFVHIQHLDPSYKSMMVDLIQGVTRMKVREARDQMRIEPNCIYIGPADRDVAIKGGRLHLIEPATPHAVRLPIDFFFRALARDRAERSIGIILSGMGSDGTLGIRAIKGAGGTTMAQDPRTAKFDGMPRSAIGTQLIDVVLAPGEAARVLREYARHPYVITGADGREPDVALGQLDQIYALLREQTGHDFAHYKTNTIQRRIERRMAVHQQKQLDDYVRYLQRFPAEVDALFRDLLIGVTNFFRDQEAFHALEERVVPRLVDASRPDGQVRVWVPGCSTGEEPYSIAMLLAEKLDAARESRKVTIFGTDIDPAAIEAARAAIYTESIAADVPAERLARHFTTENGAYRISKRVRELCIFAVQDVLKDPPFSRIGLISCRNLLIYLEPELQRRLMSLFHTVLSPGGFLFLGASETVGEAGELFTPVDKKWKVYAKKAVAAHPLLGVTRLHRLNDAPSALSKNHDTPFEPPMIPGIAEATTRVLLEHYAPACAVVDEHYDVVFFQGRTGRYLELPSGEPQLNLLKMARGELLRELRTALHKASKERVEVVRDRVLVDDGTRAVRLRLKPFRGARPSQQLVLVAFEDASTAPEHDAPSAAPPGEPDPRLADLERQLASTKESLQSTVEEVETSNEELRSMNEELQSANEELQSTNEELETSKEELQSVNEELMTVNTELQKKLEELSQANNDLTNLLNSTDIGTLFLDGDLRIKRFTPAVGKLVNLIPSDVGRPIADIVTQVLDDDLAEHAREVLRTLTAQEAEVRTKDRRWYLRRILPYRAANNVVDGVVATFVNISEVREAQRVVEAILVYTNSVMGAVRQPLVLLNKEGRVVQANQPFYAMFDVRREDVMGALFEEIDGGRWRQVRDALGRVLEGGEPLQGLEVNQELPGLGRRTLRLYAQRTDFGVKAVAGEAELTFLTIDDATASGP